MIEIVLEIIDRLLSVQKRKSERLQTLFKELVEPIFNDLMNVHTEDLQMLEQARQELLTSVSNQSNFGNTIRELANRLRERQLKFEPVRTKLRAIAEETFAQSAVPVRTSGGWLSYKYVLHESERTWHGMPKEFIEFARAVSYYLPDGTIHSRWLRAEEFVNRLSQLANSLPNVTIAIFRDLPKELSHEWNVIQVEECLDMTIGEQRTRWSLVCEAFARAKLATAKATK